MEKHRRNITVYIVIFLTGLIFSASVATMCISEKFNLNKFYDVGDICEVLYSNLLVSGTDWVYDANEWRSEISSENAAFSFGLMQPDCEWKYMKVQLGNMNVPEVKWHFYFYNSAYEVTGEQEVILTDGENLYELDAGKFSFVNITAEGQTGTKFCLERVNFYENEPVFEMGKYIAYMMLFLGIYFIVVFLLWKIFSKKISGINVYAPVCLLEDCYIEIGKVLHKIMPFTFSMPENILSRIRTILWLCMFIFMTVIDDTSNYKKVGYNYLLIVCSFILLLLAAFMMKKPLRRLYWKNKMVLCWFILWIMASVSDLFVYKDFHYTGYIMIFVIGFFAFVWGNMKHRTQVIWEMINAIRLSFLLACVFCVLFRPLIDGIRYSGINNNPIPFAIYLNMVIISFCASLLKRQKIKVKYYIWKEIVDIAAILAALYMEWRTQSTFSIILLPLVLLAFFVKSIHFDIRFKNRKFAGCLLLIVLLAFPVFLSVDWSLRNVAVKYGTQIIFDNDLFKDVAQNYYLPGTQVVYASGTEKSRIAEKLGSSKNLDQLTSGRTQYYKVYLRNMNLLGHSGSAYFYGAKHQAHNALIMIAYRYGVFVVIPYFMLMVYFFASAVKALWKNQEKIAFWFLFVISWCVGIMMMCDNVEQPFRWICWVVYFVGMGYFFSERSIDNELE